MKQKTKQNKNVLFRYKVGSPEEGIDYCWVADGSEHSGNGVNNTNAVCVPPLEGYVDECTSCTPVKDAPDGSSLTCDSAAGDDPLFSNSTPFCRHFYLYTVLLRTST